MHGRLSRIILILLLAIVSFSYSDITGNLKILALRVDFISDNYEGTTGNGKFLLTNSVNECGKYTIDPPPHDKYYFESQLIALDNYYRAVSNNKFGIDITDSAVYPLANEAAYTLPDSMSYYHPKDNKDVYDKQLVQLFSDAVTTAYTVDNIDFSKYDLIVVFHAGVSQDFNFNLDTTPEDIQSAFIDNEMIVNHYGSSGITVGNNYITQGLILPETQNHLLYKEMLDDFSSLGNICDFQYGLTGTFALFVGQAIGLPPLWNTESGESGIGVFGLMDQGSNNGRGLVPAPPTAWTRIFAGWEKPITIIPDEIVDIVSRPTGNIVKVPIDDDEYFLIENRTNWFRSTVNIDSVKRFVWSMNDTTPNDIEIIFDSVGVVFDENGVIVKVPDYDIGLPASGLLIWHIDESIINENINSFTINNNPQFKGIDLEEADGAQDIGFESIFLFNDPGAGYWGDMWFQGNTQYYLSNTDTNEESLDFGAYTLPNTRSNAGATTYLNIGNIGYPTDTMRISISNDLMATGFPDTSLDILYHIDITGDGKRDFIGGKQTMWWAEDGLEEKHNFYELQSKLNYFVVTNFNNKKNLVLLSDYVDSAQVIWFEFDQEFGIKRDAPIADLLELFRYLKGNKNSDAVDFVINEPEIQMNNIKTGTTIIAKISPDGGIVRNGDTPELSNINFQYLSAIDLDLDGIIEILAIDENGNIYAINKNFTIVSGFPIDVNAIPPILARDIYGNNKPELIVQNTNGDILILNNQGVIEHQLAHFSDSKLKMISEYGNKNAIITESAIWTFDDYTSVNGNEWYMYHHDEMNSNTIEISYNGSTTQTGKLFDIDRTYVYPNPVRDESTTIRVFIEDAEEIELKIYDAAGYFVERIHNEINELNEIVEIKWDVSDLESGIYLIKLFAKKGSNTESTILKVGVIH